MRTLFKSVFLLLILAFAYSPLTAFAKQQIIGWTWPTMDCDGIVLSQSDLLASDLIYSTSPMPMPSDVNGACAASADPEAPSSATSVSVPITETSILLNLKPGQTYYARIRVSAYVDGNWSAWSAEKDFTVPYGRPDRVIVSGGWFQYISEVITDPVIRLNAPPT